MLFQIMTFFFLFSPRVHKRRDLAECKCCPFPHNKSHLGTGAVKAPKFGVQTLVQKGVFTLPLLSEFSWVKSNHFNRNPHDLKVCVRIKYF